MATTKSRVAARVEDVLTPGEPTKTELHAEARRRGIKGRSRMNTAPSRLSTAGRLIVRPGPRLPQRPHARSDGQQGPRPDLWTLRNDTASANYLPTTAARAPRARSAARRVGTRPRAAGCTGSASSRS